MANTT